MKTYACSCGDSYTADEVAARGHDFDESIVANVTVDEANADVNADKVVDLKDAAVLTRYLVGGWNVTLL